MVVEIVLVLMFQKLARFCVSFLGKFGGKALSSCV